MAIKLEITVNDDCPYEDIWRSFETQMRAIGFSRTVGVAPGLSAPYTTPKEPPVGSTTVQFTDKPNLTVVDTLSDALARATERFDTAGSGETGTTHATGATATATFTAGNIINGLTGEMVQKSETPLSDMDGDRKRGEAGAGHRRRTNAQIAADEAYFKQKERAEEALRQMDKGVHDHVERATIDELQSALAISSGEERVNPEDAADEAVEAHSGPPTLEDLRAEVAKYIETFGVKASVENMRSIIGCRIDQVPAKEIPNAIAKVRAAIGGSTILTPNSPADDSPVPPGEKAPEMENLFGGEPAKSLTATKEMVVEIIKVYGRKFDGSDDPEKMVIAKEDLPKVFTKAFGAGVTGMGSMPEKTPEAFGNVWRAIRDAVEKNPFGRKAK